jgi:tetratricopeptide (TPR) repeat protein
MKKFIMLTLAVLGLALQPLAAQTSEGPDNHKFHKAVDILDEGGDPKEARKLAYENIKENPKHIDSYLLIAGIDRNEMDYASALGIIEKAMKNNHKNSGFSEALLLWWKGIIYDELGDSRKAVETMERVVTLARKTDNDHLIDMMENLAQFRYDLKEYDESDAVYREMMKIDESTLLPRIGIARNLIARDRYDEALTALEECKKYDKDYSEIYRFQMRAYEGKKEYKKMIDSMMTLYEKCDDSDYLDIDKFMKDVKYSVALLREKIASESDNGLWKAVLAAVYQESHMYPEVVAILSELISEYGLDADLLEERAESYSEMGMTDLALADINEVIGMCKDGYGAYYYARRSEINRSAGRYAESIADITKFIDRYPTEATAIMPEDGARNSLVILKAPWLIIMMV